MSFLENMCCEYFFPSLGLPCALLLLSFNEHKLLILMKPNLSTSYCWCSLTSLTTCPLIVFWMARLILRKCPVLSALYFWAPTCPDPITLGILQSLSYPSSSGTYWLIDLSLFPISWACLSSFFFFFWFAYSVSAVVPFLGTINYPVSDLAFSFLCWCGFKQKFSCGSTQSGKISKMYTCPLPWVVLSGPWGQTREERKTRAAQWDPRGWLSWEPAGITEHGQSREQMKWRTLRLKRGKRAFILLFGHLIKSAWALRLGRAGLPRWRDH